MANVILNRFKANLCNKEVDLEADVIKVMLLTSSYTPDADHNVIGDVSANEVSGAGYTAGGATLAGKAVTEDDANDRAKFDANDTAWADSTITARYAAIYDTTVTDNLICIVDFGTDKTSSTGAFTIQWDTDGIVRLA